MKTILAALVALILGAVWVGPVHAAASVSSHTSAAFWSSCSNPTIEDFTVPTGTTWLIVTSVSTISGTPGVTWNGTSLTVGPSDESGTMKVHSYYLEDPEPGNLTLALATSLGYCHVQAAAITSDGSFVTETDAGTGGSTGFSTSTAGLVYDVLGVNDDVGTNWDAESSQTVLEETFGGTGSGSYSLAIDDDQSLYSFGSVPWARVTYYFPDDETTTTSSTTNDLEGYAQAGVFSLGLLTMVAAFVLAIWASQK